MRVHITVGLAMAFGAGQASAANTGPVEVERCGVGILANGEMAQVPLPGLHILGIGVDSKVVLPKDAPPAVLAVVCGRRSRLPAGYDEKVVQAGYPFYIVGPDGETTVLEAVKGKLQANAENGEFTTEETIAVRAWVDAAQARLDKRK